MDQPVGWDRTNERQESFEDEDPRPGTDHQSGFYPHSLGTLTIRQARRLHPFVGCRKLKRRIENVPSSMKESNRSPSRPPKAPAIFECGVSVGLIPRPIGPEGYLPRVAPAKKMAVRFPSSAPVQRIQPSSSRSRKITDL